VEDAFYIKLRTRVESRLSKSPTLITIHALLFTVIGFLLGLWGLVSHPLSIDGVAYWIIFIWSIILFGHTAYSYLNSGAWERKREARIQDEVLDAGETYDLDQDEMLTFHLQLSEDIQKRSQNFNPLFLNGLGNLALWPGLSILMFILFKTNMIQAASFRATLFLSVFGTLLLGFLLPVRRLWQRQPADSERHLRAVYGYGRKRKGMALDNRKSWLEEHEDEDETAALNDADSRLKGKL
jgi:hypothetical protein